MNPTAKRPPVAVLHVALALGTLLIATPEAAAYDPWLWSGS